MEGLVRRPNRFVLSLIAMLGLAACVPIRAAIAGTCGDSVCDGTESCETCSADCGMCTATRLTSSPGTDRGPAWGPDGQTIAYESDRNGIQNEIFAVDADGSNERLLVTVSAPGLGFRDLAWIGATGDLLA